MTTDHWQPSASLHTLKKRAAVLQQVRRFFYERDILEVDTPLLASHSVTDPHMPVISTENPLGHKQRYYLQTSPEYAMKRLLAAGSGAIYQLCKSFRAGERGSRHNPEFTMLEWYRPGYDHHQLMAEVETLINSLMPDLAAFEKCSYRQLFLKHFDIDPHKVDCQQLGALAKQHLDVQMSSDNRDDWLNLLLAEVIEPTLGVERPVFIYDYPASQSALAKVAVDSNGASVAQRFELYINGLELANGYFELTDAKELQRRGELDRQSRQLAGLAMIDDDKYLVAAMQSGLPDCAGVALGLDRLMMLVCDSTSITDVLAFPSDIA
jgi:lysyl-tRNA synthetase class 2